ncbi:transposase [Rhodocaloribacter litoris]|uniref:transposase n=1 Tax=Rhodocaloribacter litoris TaxID=2558931 RepID=UPI00141E17AB|nr:transposase [Rhodocaloribacter litoris]QXD13943.1 transposase [Rhodocaloribacter litoris]
MIHPDALLFKLIALIDKLPQPKTSPRRGRPVVYPETLFLKALVIMTLRHLYQVGAFLAVLDQPDMASVKAVLLDEQGRFPCRRTWERRLANLPESLPARIGLIGRMLVEMIKPWANSGRAVALDSTILHASGGVWHKKHRDAGLVPHSRIDTEAAWTQSGWHGWVYGWKLHLAVTVASVWIPVAARLRPANEADNVVAEDLIPELPFEVRYVLGDKHYNAPNVTAACRLRNLFAVTTKRGAYPHTDDGVEVRRIFHKLRSVANENFNEQFKAIFNGHDRVPTKGLVATQRYALGAVLVYQLVLWHRYEQGLPLRQGLKAYIKAA